MPRRDQHGISLVLISVSMAILLGIAAIAVDLAAGWAERRRDQTTADLAAVAGVISFVAPVPSEEVASTVLAVAAANLSIDPTDFAYLASWKACTDPGRPPGFVAVPAPSGWGAATVPCISASHQELRVVLPTQVVSTFFGPAVGVDEIRTSAVAHARAIMGETGGIRPFGLLNGIPSGISCLTTSPSGLAVPPCDGPASGNFGTINSQTWGSESTRVDCGTPGNDELGLAIATGIDHLIGVVPYFPGSGGSYTSFPADLARLDDCKVIDGQGFPTDPMPSIGPSNTLKADTGFNLFQATKNGLLSGEDGFPNATVAVTPVLQNLGTGSFSTRLIRERRNSSAYSYLVDNTPLWMHLRPWPELASDGIAPALQTVCSRSDIGSSPDPTQAMSACLFAYETTLSGYPNMPPLFEESIAKNPRFGFVPQFHFTNWGSGNHWQPVLRFRMIYLDTIWFNCNEKYDPVKNDSPCDGTKGATFRPLGSADESTIQVGNGGSMKQLRLDQITAFVLPDQSIGESTVGSYPGHYKAPYQVELIR